MLLYKQNLFIFPNKMFLMFLKWYRGSFVDLNHYSNVNLWIWNIKSLFFLYVCYLLKYLYRMCMFCIVMTSKVHDIEIFFKKICLFEFREMFYYVCIYICIYIYTYSTCKISNIFSTYLFLYHKSFWRRLSKSVITWWQRMFCY